MKKSSITIIAIVMTAALALCFAACGSGEQNTGNDAKPAKTFDVVELAKNIYDNCTFDGYGPELSSDPEFTVCKVCGADPALIAGEEGAKKAAAYVAAATPEMVICVEAVDKDAAQKLMDDTFTPLIEGYIHDYTNYSPAEVAKLESAVKIVEGNYVIVVVSGDNSAASAYIAGLLG